MTTLSHNRQLPSIGNKRLSINLLDLLLLLLLAAIWGGSYLFMRMAGPALGSVVLMGLRVGLAAVALFGYTLAIGDLPDFRRYWKEFLILGALNNAIPFVLIANAVIDLNASLASIINATTPLFTAVVATVWIKESFGLKKISGVLVGISGVIILMGWNPLPLTTETVWATMQALLAALSYGLAAVYARTRFKGVAPLHTSVGQLVGSSVLLVPAAWALAPATFPSSTVIIAVLGLALLCTALAYLIYFRLISSAGATQAAAVTFLIPFFSLLWGVTLLGERLNVGMFVGLAIILGSVWLVLSARS